jgi:CBS domain-containing protein
MAKNPRWTQSISTWKKYFTDWIHTGNPHDILEASIFFDFRHVFGEENLIRELREHVNQVSDNKSVFYYHMAQAVVKFKPPLNIFGKIVGNESGTDEINLDIKKVIFPVITFIRLYAIREKLGETNSMERASQLHARKIIDRSIFEDLLQAYSFMTNVRLRAQVESIIQNEIPGNLVDLNKLSRIETTTFKKILAEIGELQTKVNFDFKGTE